MSETIRPNLLFHWYRYSHPNDRQLSPPRGPPAVAPRPLTRRRTEPFPGPPSSAPHRAGKRRHTLCPAARTTAGSHVTSRCAPGRARARRHLRPRWTCDRSTDFIDAMSVKQELRTATTLTIIVLYRDRASTPAAMRDPIRDPPRPCRLSRCRPARVYPRCRAAHTVSHLSVPISLGIPIR